MAKVLNQKPLLCSYHSYKTEKFLHNLGLMISTTELLALLHEIQVCSNLDDTTGHGDCATSLTGTNDFQQMSSTTLLFSQRIRQIYQLCILSGLQAGGETWAVKRSHLKLLDIISQQMHHGYVWEESMALLNTQNLH